MWQASLSQPATPSKALHSGTVYLWPSPESAHALRRMHTSFQAQLLWPRENGQPLSILAPTASSCPHALGGESSIWRWTRSTGKGEEKWLGGELRKANRGHAGGVRRRCRSWSHPHHAPPAGGGEGVAGSHPGLPLGFPGLTRLLKLEL